MAAFSEGVGGSDRDSVACLLRDEKSLAHGHVAAGRWSAVTFCGLADADSYPTFARASKVNGSEEPVSLGDRCPGHHFYRDHSFTFRSRKALLMTETELRLMAAPAMIGLSSRPKNGYSAPAATGIPNAL